MNATPELREPLRVIEVIENEVGQPRNDGTPGSGLYQVPLRLNRVATDLEARLIEQTWDSPPRWTTMHRPGICSVSGDTLSLDGTTLAELKQYHLETLNVVLDQVNREVRDLEAREKVRRERDAADREQLLQEQRQQVADINKTLDRD